MNGSCKIDSLKNEKKKSTFNTINRTHCVVLRSWPKKKKMFRRQSYSNETYDEAILSACKPWNLNTYHLISNHHFNDITSMALNGNIDNELRIFHNGWVQLPIMGETKLDFGKKHRWLDLSVNTLLPQCPIALFVRMMQLGNRYRVACEKIIRNEKWLM